MKESKSENLVLVGNNRIIGYIRQKVNFLYEHTINSKWGNRIFLILGILIMISYLFFFFFKEPIVNEEVRPEVTNNLIPWEVKDGENFLIAMIERPFDLKITELGQYRPRYLSFLIQFFEENVFLRLTRAFPVWGNRAPFFPIAMILTVISIIYFIKVVWKKIPNGFSVFVASTIVMFQNYQVATYWRARSAKLFALSACIFVIAFALKYINEKINRRNIVKILYVPIIFLLMTLDEQVLAIMVMLTGFSMLFCIINKKINIVSVIYIMTTILYATFHLWWGKFLFGHFTGELSKHGHSIDGVFQNLNFEIFKQANSILSSTIGKVTFLSVVVFVVICIYSFFRILKNNQSKKEKVKTILTGCFLFISSNVLLAIMIDSHPAIYNLKCLWKSVYPVVPTIILFLGYIYVIANSKFIIDSLKPFIVLFGVTIALIYNMSNISREYYGAYLAENGGFMSEVTDMEITQDEIITKAVTSESMQFKNDSMLSSFYTFFTTSNVNDAKIIEGEESKSDEGIIINNEFSCYLVTQKERKLYLKLNLFDYEKYKSISVYINRIKLAEISVESNEIEQEFDVRTERYRAGKITIIANQKDGNKEVMENMLLKELYMK